MLSNVAVTRGSVAGRHGRTPRRLTAMCGFISFTYDYR
jgi:hypothetical protein